MAGRDRIALGDIGFEQSVGAGGCGIRGHLRRRPHQLEQPVLRRGRNGRTQLLLGDRSHRHGGHRQHRQPERVGQLDRGRLGGRLRVRHCAGGRDAGAHCGGAGSVQRHTLPGERQHHLGLVGAVAGDDHGMHCRIEQCRVHAESVDAAGRIGQPHLGEYLIAADPGGGQTLERGAVTVSAGRQRLVRAGRIHRDGARRRPHGQIRVLLDRRGAQHALGVAHPGGVGTEAGEDRDATPTGFSPASVRCPVGRIHHDLDGHRTESGLAGGQQQRCLQRQLLDGRAADFVTGADRQLDEPGARKHHGARHRVIGKPALHAR